MATELGVGAGAAAIFAELDDNGSGTVTYSELAEALAQRQARLSTETQQLLAHSMWGSTAAPDAAENAAPKVDTRGFKISARDVAGVKQQMQQQVAASGAHVADVLRLFDMDAGCERLIDDME